jgi:NPCBM/NEW2 domain/Chitobiase/beta-hexosaminidase C-terminal domain
MKRLIKNLGRRNFIKSIGLALAATSSCTPHSSLKVSGTELDFDLQRRDPASGNITVSTETLDPRKVGIIVVDMWNYHWCRTCLPRAGALVPRMNVAFERARSLGMQVIFLPTDVILAYEFYPQRQAVLALPNQPLPPRTNLNPPNAIFPDYRYCECGPGPQCLTNYGWTAMNSTLQIRENDLIANGEHEVYNICAAHGLTHLVYAGIATNICLLGKPGAASNMIRDGMKCMFARDLTDGFSTYDLERGLTPDQGTSEAIAAIERSAMPSIDLLSTLGKAGTGDDSILVDSVLVTPWGRMFEDSVQVTLTAPRTPDAEIHYTIDGREPTEASPVYARPFVVKETCTLKTIGFHRGTKITLPSTAEFLRVPAAPLKAQEFLAELKPASSKLGWPHNEQKGPSLNRSIGGRVLTVRGKKYEHGLGVNSVTELTYDLKPEHRRFVALGGIDEDILGDDLGRMRASYAGVVFKVYIDDRLVARSPMMRIQYVPWPFDVEIPKGSRQIKLVVDDGAGGEQALASPTYPESYRDMWWTPHTYVGHADWLEAGFVTRT